MSHFLNLFFVQKQELIDSFNPLKKQNSSGHGIFQWSLKQFMGPNLFSENFNISNLEERNEEGMDVRARKTLELHTLGEEGDLGRLGYRYAERPADELCSVSPSPFLSDHKTYQIKTQLHQRIFSLQMLKFDQQTQSHFKDWHDCAFRERKDTIIYVTNSGPLYKYMYIDTDICTY